MPGLAPSAINAQAIFADSATMLGQDAARSVVFCGSHGGMYSAACALAAGVAGIVLNDAGVGREDAGVAGLLLLDEHGVPAATVDRGSSLIGSAQATASGTLSRVNERARALGVVAGASAEAFLAGVVGQGTHQAGQGAAPSVEESRLLLHRRPVPVWALDSASLARPTDAGAVIVTGSHAQLVGGSADSALRVDARIAIFNDAGGVVSPSRLEALDLRGIAAVAVAASSARIGDARSSFFDGVISAVNPTAAADGATVSTPVRAYVMSVIGHTTKEAMG